MAKPFTLGTCEKLYLVSFNVLCPVEKTVEHDGTLTVTQTVTMVCVYEAIDGDGNRIAEVTRQYDLYHGTDLKNADEIAGMVMAILLDKIAADKFAYTDVEVTYE